MAKASDNPFPSILIAEGTEPSAPAAGKQRLYIDSTTHHLMRVPSTGVEVDLEGTGGGDVATDSIWDAKGDLAAATGADAASKLTVGSNGKILVAASGQTTGLLWDTGYLGGLELVYKYTVAGSDKASIDTGADTADAGTNSWSSGDVLEIFLVGRTDESSTVVNTNFTVNNDTGSNYDIQNDTGLTNTPSSNASIGTTAWVVAMSAASATSGRAGSAHIVIPNFTGTTFWKEATMVQGSNDGTAANQRAVNSGLCWRSTSAITRVKWAAAGAAKLVVGSQMLIYKRRNA